MGLFDFAKGIGKKLFHREAQAAEAATSIQEHIEADNPGVDNLQVEFDNGTVKLSGTAGSSEAVEKAVLMAGNVEGVTKVEIDGMEAPPLTVGVEYYEIQSGDTLWKIAKQFYGAGNRYTEIFEANREVIKDPDKIYPGQKIRIPAAS